MPASATVRRRHDRRRPPGRRLARLLGWLALAFVTLQAVHPGGATAQTPSLADRELEYRSAARAWDAARAAWAVYENRFSEAIDAMNQARRSGDAERLQDAQQNARTVALELSRLDARVRETRAAAARARQALRQALDDRRDRLEVELATATPARRDQITALLRDLDVQYQELERQDEGGLQLELVYYPSIQFDPRDGPVELQAKAELLERRAAQADSLLAEVDERIGRLEARLRRERAARTFLAGLDRFEDTRVPVAPPARQSGGSEGAGEPAADSSGVDLGDLPLDQQIERLRIFRAQVEQARDQFVQRARLFRERLRRTS